ncbi:MAG: response regulator [Polaromonas sp.]|nr:response regulator [Polaromonas sp.]
MSTPVFSCATAAADGAALPRILVVDDQADIRDPMAQFLKARGFAVGTAPDGSQLHERLASEVYDLILMDVMMPGEDGLALCRQVQERGGPPVILLTAMGETADRVHGLETGADDYVVKPFEPSELLARIRTVLRRAGRQASLAPPSVAAAEGIHIPARATRAMPRFRFERWTFDPLQNEVVHEDGRSVALSAGEARLLHAFVTHPHEVLSREKLLDLCTDSDADVFDRSIDSQMSRLRRKIEVESRKPRLLKTAWGNGYLFAATVQAAA